MHICVLGAGVIGVTTAHQLLRAGHEVTLVESQAEPGRMTSYGNGAQLSYSYVAPLADPSVWSKWPHYLFSPDSPLTLKPRLDPAQWSWLIKFLAASNTQQVKRTTIDLLQLAFFSRDKLAQMLAATPLDFAYRTAGKLVMFTDAAALESARSQVDFQAAYGCSQQVISAARCLEIEPALAASSRQWAGGVYTASEEAGDCALFCSQLLESMTSSAQFHFLPNTSVSGASISNNSLRAVSAGGREIEADSFVLAMGVDSAAFARKLGFALPVYPLKGYSITVPVDADSAGAAPQVSITDLSRKIVYARLGDRLRVAGRVEIVGMDRSIPQRAVQELVSGTKELFPGCGDLSDHASLSPWAGFRPATPTGLPIIGKSPVGGLYLNVGHGALGWTLACGSAALLAELMEGRPASISAQPYAYA
ncbi:D-amino acid dehydrogenase [Undibacterium sp. TJN25]|uniref:D-amino acid dehydrogenase n=1 Tax=Undibacterium sp. TJN25 TaxID=3413056 RepID=UPI003BF327C1